MHWRVRAPPSPSNQRKLSDVITSAMSDQVGRYWLLWLLSTEDVLADFCADDAGTDVCTDRRTNCSKSTPDGLGVSQARRKSVPRALKGARLNNRLLFNICE